MTMGCSMPLPCPAHLRFRGGYVGGGSQGVCKRARHDGHGVHILHRVEGDRAHFLTLTFWDSRKAIEAFAGKDIEIAKYYPEDKNFLLEFERTVTHYEVSDGAVAGGE